MTRPRLLILTPRFPYPVVGGDRLRIYQVCKALAGQADLTLLSLCETRQELDLALPDDGVFQAVERVYLPKWQSWLQCALALFTREPLQIAYYRSGAFHRRLQALLPRHGGVLAHLIRTGDALRGHPGPKFLEMTDAISLNYSRIKQMGPARKDLRSRIFALEAQRLRAYENTVVDHFDVSFLVSDIDRQFLYGGDAARLARVMVCSNGVDVGALPYQFQAAGRDIVFIGNMMSLQNLDMVKYMVADILPLVQREFPDTVLRVIGRIRAADAQALAQHPAVAVAGEVDSVAAAAAGGGVGVCPMRIGAGVQNKVLEYMALGLPTVTTSQGLEGFQAQDGRELVVADDATAFAGAIIALLRDRARAAAMAEAGRRYVERQHSWDAVLAPLVAAVGEHCARAGAAPAPAR